MLVDSHVNLHGEKFADDIDDVIKRAIDNNVRTMLNICCKVSDYDDVIAVAERYENMCCLLYTSPSPRDRG